jgi:hypothetical protein
MSSDNKMDKKQTSPAKKMFIVVISNPFTRNASCPASQFSNFVSRARKSLLTAKRKKEAVDGG